MEEEKEKEEKDRSELYNKSNLGKSRKGNEDFGRV
jgi:hypothetical protein